MIFINLNGCGILFAIHVEELHDAREILVSFRTSFIVVILNSFQNPFTIYVIFVQDVQHFESVGHLHILDSSSSEE